MGYSRPNLSVHAVIGQSYRLTDKPSLFPEGTGLTDRFSDVVAQATIRYGRFAALTQRLRLDKDDGHVRRNETDFTIGGRRTYVTAGYFRLNRNVDTAIEDLRDREEVRLGGRVQITRTVSVFGSTVVDLTGPRDDPQVVTDGYQPVVSVSAYCTRMNASNSVPAIAAIMTSSARRGAAVPWR